MRLRKTLVDQRSAWQHRIQAQLFHHGVPKASRLLTPARRAQLTQLELPDSARSLIATALALIDHIDEQLAPIEAELRSFARRQPGCLALQGHFGIGELTSVAILAELGYARRFSSSRHAVRFAGLDVTVSQSDQSRAPGKLSHQGPPVLRWAAFEAAQCGWRERSPDHHYYLETKARLGRQAGGADDRPQADPPRPPHPARATSPARTPTASPNRGGRALGVGGRGVAA